MLQKNHYSYSYIIGILIKTEKKQSRIKNRICDDGRKQDK